MCFCPSRGYLGVDYPILQENPSGGYRTAGQVELVFSRRPGGVVRYVRSERSSSRGIVLELQGERYRSGDDESLPEAPTSFDVEHAP